MLSKQQLQQQEAQPYWRASGLPCTLLLLMRHTHGAAVLCLYAACSELEGIACCAADRSAVPAQKELQQARLMLMGLRHLSSRM